MLGFVSRSLIAAAVFAIQLFLVPTHGSEVKNRSKSSTPATELLVHLSSSSDDESLSQVLQLLKRLEYGQELLVRAAKAFRMPLDESNHLPKLDLETWKKIVIWDHVSRTDAVLTRHFDSQTGEEMRERQVSIHLKRNQSFSDLFFDLSHELTHAVSGPNWDPYDPDLTATKYVVSALEAPGGEIDAIFTECRLAFEVLNQRQIQGEEWIKHGNRCARYAKNGSLVSIDRDRIKDEFYRVGKWYTNIKRELGEDWVTLPKLSSESPKLYSSTGGAPYPVALIREYQEINSAACANSKRRLKSVSESGRLPASQAEFGPSVSADIKGKTETFLRLRCAASKS